MTAFVVESIIGNYSATSNNTKLVHWPSAVDGWAVTFGTATRGLGGLRPSPVFGRPLGLGLCHRKSVRPSVRPSVCNVDVLWPNGLSDRDDFGHTPCPGQQ